MDHGMAPTYVRRPSAMVSVDVDVMRSPDSE